jgi:tetratricopeptide (TPR) repeat protein
MYQAWNRAIKIARGTYITNSNTDDRHEPTACERLAHHLDTHAEIDLAYGNCYVSTQENETYQENDKKTLYRFPQYFAPNAPLHYQFGPQPLWRSSLHAQIGYFSETLRAAGDYDFNLRFAVAGCKAQRIEGPPTGLYLAHAQAISFKDSTITKETEELYAQYRTPEAVLSCYQAAGVIPTNQGDVSAIFTDFAVRALEYFPPWFSGGAHREVVLAKQFLAHALTAQPTYPAALVNLALCEAADGDIVRAQELLGRALEHDGNRAIIESNRSALTPGNANSGMFTLYPSGLTLASQREISLL